LDGGRDDHLYADRVDCARFRGEGPARRTGLTTVLARDLHFFSLGNRPGGRLGSLGPRRTIMADQKNRGGQKKGKQQPNQPEQKQGTATTGEGMRSDRDKRQDQMNNPDDARRQPTNMP